MPLDETVIVAGYIQWLYSGGHITPDTAKDNKLTEYSWLVKAYIFGDRIQDDQFCNSIIFKIAKAMDRAINNRHQFHCSEVLDLIYSETPKSSLLRRLVVDVYAARCNEKIISETFSDAPREFLLELLIKFANQTLSDFRSITGRCHEWYT